MSDISFTSSAPGFWADENISTEDWNSAKWQLKNRVSSLADIEKHLILSEEERAGILLTGTKLATSITPHFFNLIHPTDPDCPIRRQVIPRIEETYNEHARILIALAARKRDEAQMMLRTHIEQSKIEVRKISLSMLSEARNSLRQA